MVTMKAVSVIGSYVGSLAEMRELMAIARRGTLPNLPVAARPLGQVGAVLDELRAGRVRGRAVVHP
jgi:alcohol dehydrogenase/propanol-preferring alcohol dehydrogenase